MRICRHGAFTIGEQTGAVIRPVSYCGFGQDSRVRPAVDYKNDSMQDRKYDSGIRTKLSSGVVNSAQTNAAGLMI
jgi:hypothetical protein